MMAALLTGIVLGWILFGLATLPRGSGWPLWLWAGAQFALMLCAVALVHSGASPYDIAPGFANLWFLITILAAGFCRNSAALVTQQLTIAAVCLPLVIYGFAVEAPVPLWANVEQGNLLVLFSAGVVAYSLVYGTVGFFCALLWVEQFRGVRREATAPAQGSRSKRRQRPQEVHSTPRLRATERLQAFVTPFHPDNVGDASVGSVPCAPLLVIFFLSLPLYGLLRSGAWLAQQLSGPTSDIQFSLAERLRVTVVVLVLQFGAFALLHGLVTLVF